MAAWDNDPVVTLDQPKPWENDPVVDAKPKPWEKDPVIGAESPTPASDKALSETSLFAGMAPVSRQQQIEGSTEPTGIQKRGTEEVQKVAAAAGKFITEQIPRSPQAFMRAANIPTDWTSPVQLAEFAAPAIKPMMDLAEGAQARTSQIYQAWKNTPPGSQERYDALVGAGLDAAQIAAMLFTGGEVSKLGKAGEVADASKIPSPESVPQPEIRPPVGEEAPLRQQGETAGTQEPVVAKPPQETPQPVTVYHGTPYEIPSFSFERAGAETNRGGTSFGLGINLTEDIGHAKAYAGKGGNVYSVDIPKSDIGSFISWEKPVPKNISSELPEIDLEKPIPFGGGATIENIGGQWKLQTGTASFPLRESEVTRMFGDANTGEQAYRKLVASLGNERAASQWLLQKGIKGITNVTERGVPNYTVFDPSILTIKGKVSPVPEAGQAPVVGGEKPTVGADVGAVPQTGIANKYLDEVYGDASPAVVAGKGPKEWKALGQARLDDFQATGNPINDPYAVLTALREGKVPVAKLPHDVSLLRAEHQRLVEDARNSEGTPQYPQKAQAAFDMATAIKQVAHGPASDVFRAIQEHDAPRYDNVTDFDQATRERLKREATPEEKTHFQRIAKDVRTTADAAGKEVEIAQRQVQKYRGKEKMSFDDAAKSIHDQISQLVKDCGL